MYFAFCILRFPFLEIWAPGGSVDLREGLVLRRWCWPCAPAPDVQMLALMLIKSTTTSPRSTWWPGLSAANLYFFCQATPEKRSMSSLYLILSCAWYIATFIWMKPRPWFLKENLFLILFLHRSIYTQLSLIVICNANFLNPSSYFLCSSVKCRWFPNLTQDLILPTFHIDLLFHVGLTVQVAGGAPL